MLSAHCAAAMTPETAAPPTMTALCQSHAAPARRADTREASEADVLAAKLGTNNASAARPMLKAPAKVWNT